MRSPFPGMDPYLESRWREVHAGLIVYSRDRLQEQLPKGLFARVEEDVVVDAGDDVRRIGPDTRVVETATAEFTPTSTSTAVVAEPLLVSVDEPIRERHIEIIDADGRLVTAIEFLSPTNKRPGSGRDKYERKQRDYLDAGVNLVEIDLVRAGPFTLAAPEEKLTAPYRTPYRICIRRLGRLQFAELYRAPLREPLPVIPIPLRLPDSDVVLELQSLIERCYKQGRYAESNLYAGELSPPLSPEDAVWADELLRTAGFRD